MLLAGRVSGLRRFPDLLDAALEPLTMRACISSSQEV
jgi:uncharacterized protein YunC (DUF1805 family)